MSVRIDSRAGESSLSGFSAAESPAQRAGDMPRAGVTGSSSSPRRRGAGDATSTLPARARVAGEAAVVRCWAEELRAGDCITPSFVVSLKMETGVVDRATVPRTRGDRGSSFKISERVLSSRALCATSPTTRSSSLAHPKERRARRGSAADAVGTGTGENITPSGVGGIFQLSMASLACRITLVALGAALGSGDVYGWSCTCAG
jgi:hypothetical protein